MALECVEEIDPTISNHMDDPVGTELIRVLPDKFIESKDEEIEIFFQKRNDK